MKKALRHNKYGNIQRYLCKECGKRFSFNIGFEKIKHSPQGVTTAMQLYFSGESLRNTAESLQLIGVSVSHQTIYSWIKKYVILMTRYMEQIVQVKSGRVGVKDIRELRDVVSMQKAAIGLFLTLEKPTSEMNKETKATDPYVSPVWKHEYPKIQVLTIDELLKGKRPSIPPTISVYQEAPLTARTSSHQQKTLFQS